MADVTIRFVYAVGEFPACDQGFWVLMAEYPLEDQQ
jgi:hypothetical protein